MNRVLVCAYACAPPGSPTFHGGEELLGWRLVQELGRHRDLDVLVSGEHRPGIEQASSLPGVRFVFVDLPTVLRPLRRVQGGAQAYAYLWQVAAYRTARRLHRTESYALFHHLTYANDWMASHIGSLLPIPFVRGPGGGAHQVPEALLPGYGWTFRLAQRLRRWGQRWMRRDPFYRRGQDAAEALFVCTRESMDALPRRWRQKAELLPVVGLQESEFPDDADRTSEPFTVLTAGKLLKHKGFDLAIRAFASFRRESGEGRLILAGRGPERDALERLAREEGVAPHVSFPGWLPRSRVLERMRDSHVLLFPSLRDGGGAVVVEAMAAGLPVVCLDVAGPGLHVTDECGVPVDPRPPDRTVRGLTEALHRLHRSPGLRREMGQRGRRRAWERYRWSRHADRLLSAYDRARAPGSSRRPG